MQAQPQVILRPRTFAALGGVVTIEAHGDRARSATERAEAAIRDLQRRLTRFEPDSELSRLNADPRVSVPASPVMLRFAEMVAYAGRLSQGLVDATCLDAVERAGYTRSLGPEAVPSAVSALADGPGSQDLCPAGPDPRNRWQTVSVDPVHREVTRPPGVRLDSGGIGKGLAADLGAEALTGTDTFAVTCAGDIRFGGNAQLDREILVASPWGDMDPIARVTLAEGAIATSGVTRRSWIDSNGRVAHHLIDPLSGRPARTGVLQATAIAPTGVEAEIRAKAALLSGPAAAPDWLVHGGAIFLSEGRTIAIGEKVEQIAAGR